VGRGPLLPLLLLLWGYGCQDTPPEDPLQAVHRTVRWAGLHKLHPTHVHYRAYHPRTGAAYLELTCVDWKGNVHRLSIVCPVGEPCTPSP